MKKTERPCIELQIPMLNNKKPYYRNSNTQIVLLKKKHPNSQIRENVKNWKTKSKQMAKSKFTHTKIERKKQPKSESLNCKLHNTIPF